MTTITPLLAVDDVAKSMDYYEGVFGFRKGLTLPGDDGKLSHGEVHIGDQMIMFSPVQLAGSLAATKLAQGALKGAGVTLYLNLDEQDIDRYYDDVKRGGAKLIEEIQDQFWGDRTFTVEDIDGYLLTFAKHVRDIDFSEMQATAQ